MITARSFFTLLLVGVVVASAQTAADTLYMKNGSRVDGTVVKQTRETITLRVGNREVRFRSTEVVHLEPNTKTGGFDIEKAKAEGLKRQAELFAETGLTSDQRREAKELLWSLQSSDKQVSAHARKRLVDMGRQVNLVRYLESYLPSMSHRLLPGVLEVLCELDRPNATRLVREYCTHLHPETRAKALELVGRLKDTESIELLSRGLLDPAPEAQAAAAEALGVLRVKQATPALIASLDVPSIRVRSACRYSLQEIWSAEGNVVDFDSAQEWEEFWRMHAQEVAFPMTISSLRPLVDPTERYEDE